MSAKTLEEALITGPHLTHLLVVALFSFASHKCRFLVLPPVIGTRDPYYPVKYLNPSCAREPSDLKRTRPRTFLSLRTAPSRGKTHLRMDVPPRLPILDANVPTANAISPIITNPDILDLIFSYASPCYASAKDRITLRNMWSALRGEGGEEGLYQGRGEYDAAGWRGVTVEDGRVTRVDWRCAGKGGRLWEGVGELEALEVLYLNGNACEGEVPKSLGRLSRLRYIDISNNKFQGVLPQELGGCENLEYLSFMKNRFWGKVPATLKKLTQLKYLSFHGNDEIEYDQRFWEAHLTGVYIAGEQLEEYFKTL